MSIPLVAPARLLLPRVPEVLPGVGTAAVLAPTVLLTGPLAAALSQRQAELAGHVVLYLPPAERDTLGEAALLDRLARVSLGVIWLAPDSAGVALAPSAMGASLPLHLDDAYLFLGDDPFSPPRSPWAVAVPVESLAALWPELGVDVAQARAARIPATRVIPELRLGLMSVLASADATVPIAATAPNVAGMLEGSDSVLKQYCLVLTVPLDQRRPRPSGVDGAAGPAAADRGSGVSDASTVSLAGLLELAHAFQALEERPKYSIVFLATSGGEPGQEFWGTNYYMFSLHRMGHRGCRPLLNLAIDLSVDGPPTGDTVAIAGLTDVDVAVPPAWVIATHPELGLAVSDGGSVMHPGSEAWAFSQRGYPSLIVRGGRAAEAAVEMEWTVRLLRFVFYVGQGVVMAAQPPQLSAVGRQRLIEASPNPP